MKPIPLPIKPGQESVWSYPRPAIVEPQQASLRVHFADEIIAATTAGFRTLETSHPPTYYFPPVDVRASFLRPSAHTSVCEWKGRAVYFDVVVGQAVAHNAAWAYPAPTGGFAMLKGCIAFYPHLMEACFVNDERVTPQAGSFYGGWITAQVVGPFKGDPGTHGW